MKKRREGDFTVGQIRCVRTGKKGCYHADYQYKGRHMRPSLHTADAMIARRKATEILNRLATGTSDLATKPIDLDDAKNRFIASLNTDGCSAKTIVKYSTEIDLFSTFAAEKGVKYVHKISPTLFDDYRAWRLKSLAAYTLYNHGVIIKGWCKFLKGRKLISEDPLADYPLKRVERPKHAATTPEENEAILTTATGPLKAILTTLSFTGLRVNECLVLRVNDIDIPGRMIKVTDGKTTAAVRSVPIHDALMPLLEAAIGTRRSGLLFPSPYPPSSIANDGVEKPWNDRTVLKQFTAIAAKHGFIVGTAHCGLTVHSLRRFFKSMAYAHGASEPLIDLWVGHKLKGMNHHYFRTTAEQQHSAMAKLPFKTPVGEGVKGVTMGE